MTLATMQWIDLRVGDILTFAAENHGDREVVTSTGAGRVRRSYSDVYNRARRLSGGLAAAGFKAGDRLATLAWNHHRHLELYYAIPGIGAAVHTLNPRMPATDLAYMVDVAEDIALFFDSDLAGLAQEIAASCTRPLRLFELSDAEATLNGAMPFEALIWDSPGPADWVPVRETDIFAICFTSGTTGSPKGVAYTHRSSVLHAMAGCMTEGQRIGGEETVLPVVPMFHANAWGLAHSAPMAGAGLVLPGRWLDGPSLLNLIKGEQVSFVCGVPTVWQGILDAAGESPDFGSLKRAGIGGAAPSRAMLMQLESAGLDVFHSWGMTETNPSAGTGLLKSSHRDEPLEARVDRKLGQGRPVFGLERRIVSDCGDPVPRDGKTPGRLLVRGNWVVGRYLNADAGLEDGWFDTGDIATIDQDGYMVIVDRAKDLIKSGGEWISSSDLESRALSVDGILQAAAIARPDEKWGERPVLFVVCRPGFAVETEQVKHALAEQLPRWQVPEDIHVRDALPLTATGKTDKKRLRSELLALLADRQFA